MKSSGSRILGCAVFSVASAALAPCADAQSWGLIGGRTESNFWTTFSSCGGRDTVCGYGPHFGGTWIPFGFFVQRPFRGPLVFEPELLYTPKGLVRGRLQL